MTVGRLAPYMYYVLQAPCSTKMRMGRIAPCRRHALLSQLCTTHCVTIWDQVYGWTPAELAQDICVIIWDLSPMSEMLRKKLSRQKIMLLLAAYAQQIHFQSLFQILQISSRPAHIHSYVWFCYSRIMLRHLDCRNRLIDNAQHVSTRNLFVFLSYNQLFNTSQRGKSYDVPKRLM